jgi:hypothetical protein
MKRVNSNLEGIVASKNSAIDIQTVQGTPAPVVMISPVTGLPLVIVNDTEDGRRQAELLGSILRSAFTSSFSTLDI